MASVGKSKNFSKKQASPNERITRENIIKKLPFFEIQTESLTFLRNKVIQYESENEVFKQKLEKYKRISDDRHDLEEELHKRRNKICALQKSLGEIQNCFFEERDRSNKLQNEVEILKLKEKEIHQKIHHLLNMVKDKKLHDEIIDIFGLEIGQKMFMSRKDLSQTEVKRIEEEPYTKWNEAEMLKEQIVYYKETIEKQTKTNKEYLDAVIRDSLLSRQEAEMLSRKDSEKIRELIKKLKEKEDDVTIINEELLETRKTLHREEILREMQKNILLKNMRDVIQDISKKQPNVNVNKMVDVLSSAQDLFESVNMDAQRLEKMLNSSKVGDFSDKVPQKLKQGLPHTQSTGQFIHFQTPTQKKSIYNRQNIFSHSKSATIKKTSFPVSPTRPYSCLKHNYSVKKNIRNTRPKTADPRRRRAAKDTEVVRDNIFSVHYPCNLSDNQMFPKYAWEDLDINKEKKVQFTENFRFDPCVDDIFGSKTQSKENIPCCEKDLKNSQSSPVRKLSKNVDLADNSSFEQYLFNVIDVINSDLKEMKNSLKENEEMVRELVHNRCVSDKQDKAQPNKSGNIPKYQTYPNTATVLSDTLNENLLLKMKSDKKEEENKKLLEELKTLKLRLAKLESYRRLELEGFYSDIKLLKERVREMEKQLYKAILMFNRSDKDLDLLQSIKTATKKSTDCFDEMKRLKLKLNHLEDELQKTS